MFKFLLRSFWFILNCPAFANTLSQKRLIVKWHGPYIGLGDKYLVYIQYFHIQMFNMILRWFVGLTIFEKLVFRILLFVVWNGPTFWTSGIVVWCKYSTFVILRLFGALPSFENLVSQKRFFVERHWPNFGPRGSYVVCTEYFWPLVVQGQSDVTQFVSDCWQGYAVTSAT